MCLYTSWFETLIYCTIFNSIICLRLQCTENKMYCTNNTLLYRIKNRYGKTVKVLKQQTMFCWDCTLTVQGNCIYIIRIFTGIITNFVQTCHALSNLTFIHIYKYIVYNHPNVKNFSFFYVSFFSGRGFNDSRHCT